MRRIWADLLLQEFDSYDMPGELGKIAVANTTYGVSAPSEGAYQEPEHDDFPEPSYEYNYDAQGMFEPEAQPGDFQFEDFDAAE